MKWLLALLLLMGQVSTAQTPPKPKPNGFWKVESERSAEITVTTFAAQKSPAKGQGLLMWALLPQPAGAPPLEPSVVLAGLYRDLKDFQLLGSKETIWGEQAAQLVSFKATVAKRMVVGRALLGQTDGGSEVLLLVTNQDAQKSFSKEFERLQSHWEFGMPPASNVLYSHTDP